MTPGQQRAVETLLARFGAPETGPLDLDALFGRHAPRHVEIGFGMGDNLEAMAQAHPENDYFGIEVYRPGVGRLLNRAVELGLENIRVSCADAVDVLGQHIPDGTLDAVYVFFPDPWPKKRHHKRRLIATPFAELVARKLKDGGHFYLATDWEDYALQMLEVLNGVSALRNEAPDGQFMPRAAFRPETKFERRGRRLGHQVWDLGFIKN